ncbi:cell division protein FtsA [Maricaulis sp.]|uniref:cell division protein FtsA n=1 Tax=Maricaulis sp. TaxID=1486257 RepID=UPI0025ED796E|nr:cell division protein FtsA [Maricaulis sp.]MDF1768248.1 cell division protein FtsA [Maricaulis sp.]
MSVFDLFRSRQPSAVSGSKSQGVCAALDVGSSKIACFIARTDQTIAGPRPRVIGVGHQSSRGMRAGAVVDMDAAAEAIRTAVEQAERMAGIAVNAVTVTLSAGQPASTRLAAEIDLPQREITEREPRRLLDGALAEFAIEDRVVLHAIPLSWSVDDHRGIKDPRGMFGKTLGVEVHVITAAIGPLRNLSTCIERCHLDLKGVVATPYASGLSALADDEVKLGATLIDMGAGATTAAVFAEGALLHIDAVPVGGSHVTSDVARGLSTPLAAAERLKTLYGSALDSPEDDQQMIEVPSVSGENGAMYDSAPRSLLNSIIRPRLEETFELIRDRLDAAGVGKTSGRRLVLTGGGAQLPGAAELAARIFGKQVRIAGPSGVSGLGDAVSGPAFSAAAGVVRRETRGAAEAIAGPPRMSGLPVVPRRVRGEAGQGGAASMWRWFAESF